MNIQTEIFKKKKFKKAPTKFENYISKKDKLTFHEKVKRLKYLSKINPEGLILAGDYDFVMTYRETQLCFIDGHFLATIVLTQAFIEKMIHSHYITLGFEEIAQKGLSQILKHAKKYKLINGLIIKKVDRIRLKRNPITHLKGNKNQHGTMDRALKAKLNPILQLEKDATDSIDVLTFIAARGILK